jgi:hypothetical protein
LQVEACLGNQLQGTMFDEVGYDGFVHAVGHGRILGDVINEAVDEGVEIGWWDDHAHQARIEGSVGVHEARAEEHVAGVGGACQVLQPGEERVADGYAALCSGQADLRGFVSNADVTVDRELEAATDAVATQDNDRGLTKVGESLARALDSCAIVAGFFGRAAGFLEVLDVGTGGEGSIAFAGEEDSASTEGNSHHMS